MYSEQEKRASVRRANDAFLRRMLGGELSQNARPTLQMDSPELPQYPTRPPCNGGDGETGNGGLGGSGVIGGACGQGMHQDDNHGHACPTQPHMPSLAMVYAPYQCWRGVYAPEEALKHGTQFAELNLPFLGYSKGTGGKPCK